jgi:hypothetical protein
MDVIIPTEMIAIFFIGSTLCGVIAGALLAPFINKSAHKNYLDPNQLAFLGIFQMSFTKGYTEHNKQNYDKFLYACAKEEYNSGYFYGLGYLYGYASWEAENKSP